MKNIKYQFEYFCSPIWIKEIDINSAIYENVSISDSPLSESLREEIKEVDKIFQSTYNDEYPPEPIQLEKVTDLLFTERVIETYKKIKIELNSHYNIFFNESFWLEKLSKLKQNKTIN